MFDTYTFMKQSKSACLKSLLILMNVSWPILRDKTKKQVSIIVSFKKSKCSLSDIDIIQ